ncbi:MAG: EamA family transporter [Bacteroidota bacterium]
MKTSLDNRQGVLFAIPAVIWGSTWYAITFQLGQVDPLYSVAYRFILAGVVLIAFCKIRNISLSFTREQHLRILLQALCLFGFNYWFAYQSEQYIASGLVALIFSLIIFLNMGFGRLILKTPLRKHVMVGAILGLIGTALIFAPELLAYEMNRKTILGLAFCLGGVLMASLGNITSAYNQQLHQLPVISTNAIGMLYGGVAMFLIAWVSGKPISFSPTLPYVLSLIYLAIIGSIISFTAYLTLIGKIGADKAAYALVIVPLIAIIISMIFEDYRLSWLAGLGIVFLILGNVIALRKSS